MKEQPFGLRPLLWMASSKKDFLKFPDEIVDEFGFQLYRVQGGSRPNSAKPLSGFGNGVWELADQFDGNAYRTVYVIRFERAVYVLHAFQKKSKRGIATHRRMSR
jgi:phage-related protein